MYYLFNFIDSPRTSHAGKHCPQRAPSEITGMRFKGKIPFHQVTIIIKGFGTISQTLINKTGSCSY